jgi:fermentation-respiration switch protein FrsA (DUF1100 family)
MAAFLKILWTSNNPLLRIARIVAVSAIVIVLAVMAFEDKLIYFPDKYPSGYWQVVETSGRVTAGVSEGALVPRIEDCWFVTTDGVRLHGWYCTPVRRTGESFAPVASKMTLLWLHGNAGNISYRFDMIRHLMALPVDIFIIDYRGYGRSEGSPGESGLYLDARAAWSCLTNERKIPADRIIIFGKSIGGVFAIDLARHLQTEGIKPAGLIVQSSFTSAADMAAAVLPFYPRALLRAKMDSISKIRDISCPKLFIHSRADEVVPFKLGYKLYEAASDPKEFYEVTNSDHNSTYISGGNAYFETLRRFVESCQPGS